MLFCGVEVIVVGVVGVLFFLLGEQVYNSVNVVSVVYSVGLEIRGWSILMVGREVRSVVVEILVWFSIFVE